MHPHLPNEILAIIIKELASSDTTLASCRLAFHTLCSLATPLLFSSILWTSSWSDTQSKFQQRAESLNQLLTNNHIACSVHTLVLHILQKNFLKSSISGGLVASILHRVPNIRHFALQNPNAYEVVTLLKFSSVADNLASAIKFLFRSPNITRLGFSDFSDLPLTLITACPNLQYLHFQRIKCDYADKNIKSSPHDIYLDSLEIDMDSVVALGSGIASHMSFAEYFSRLKTLQIRNDAYAWLFTYEGDIALLASQCLTRLEIHRHKQLIIQAHLLESAPYDLSRFPALRYFEIHLPVRSVDNTIMLDFLNQLLTISSSTSVIQTLKITIAWYFESFDEDENREAVLLPEAGWATLDDTLTSDRFPFLSQVGITLSIDDNRVHDDASSNESIITYAKALFPKFRASSNTLERRRLLTTVL